VNVAPTLKEARIGSGAGRTGRFSLGGLLIAGQVAMSLILAIAAGLFVRTLASLNSVDLGFDRDNVLVFRVDARHAAGYKDQALADFYARLEDRFRMLPGVLSAGIATFAPVTYHWNDVSLTVPGIPAAEGKKLTTPLMTVDQGFLSTMRIPVLLGRGLEERDMRQPRVAVVNENFVKEFLGGASPVGRRIGIGDKPPADIEIVGVVRNSHYNSIQEKTLPVAYVPITQSMGDLWGVMFELRTAGNAMALAPAARRIVHEANAAIPVDSLRTQSAMIDDTIAQQRTFADLCTGFAALALVIACVGLYGTLAYAVARRTNEIGIRMALGAKRPVIVWMVMRQVCVLTAAGIAIGLTVAWQAGHFVASFLYGVKENDAAVMAVASVALAIAAIAAAYAPARRASRIDPMVALRYE
jgi:predicted permease